MGFINRVSDDIQRKKMHVESIETDAGGNIKSIIVSGIERLDIPSVEGTKLEAKSILRAIAALDPSLVPTAQLIEVITISELNYLYLNGSTEQKVFEFGYYGGMVNVKPISNVYFHVTSSITNERIYLVFTPKANMPNIEYQIEELINIDVVVQGTEDLVTTKQIKITIKPNSTNPND